MILCIIILLSIGCTKYINVPVPYLVNNTIYRETVIQNHTIEYVNVTTNATHNCNVSNTSTRYIIDLITQVKRCEDNIERHWNLTECVWEIERLNKSLHNCNESLEVIKDLLD